MLVADEPQAHGTLRAVSVEPVLIVLQLAEVDILQIIINLLNLRQGVLAGLKGIA